MMQSTEVTESERCQLKHLQMQAHVNILQTHSYFSPFNKTLARFSKTSYDKATHQITVWSNGIVYIKNWDSSNDSHASYTYFLHFSFEWRTNESERLQALKNNKKKQQKKVQISESYQ